jgi:hypothetical protein
MNGAHRRDGLIVLAGPGVPAAGDIGTADITDVLPTLLALCGEPVPAGLDGRAIARALERDAPEAPDTVVAPAGVPQPYGDAAEDDVVARLTALGYLEPRA